MKLLYSILIIAQCITYSGVISPSLLTREELKGYIAHDNGDDILQLVVPSQFGMTNGGASCGYQAAFNGSAIHEILQKSPQRSELLKALQTVEARDAAFCKTESPWRSQIRVRRCLPHLKKMLEAQIGLSFKNARAIPKSPHTPRAKVHKLNDDMEVIFPDDQHQIDTDLRTLLWSHSKDILLPLTARYAVMQDGVVKCTIPASEIKESMKHRIETVMRSLEKKERLPLYEQLLENLDKFIDYKDFSGTIAPEDIANWIDSEELKAVLDMHQPNTANIFITGNNGRDPEDPLSEDIGLLTSPEYLAFAAQFQDDVSNCTGIFCLYIKGLQAQQTTMATQNEQEFTAQATSASDNGHWICMVAHKVGNQRQYIIADSASNTPRIDYYRVKEVKALLERSGYSEDEFNAWKNACRPKSMSSFFNQFLGHTAPQFVQKNPFSSGLIGGVMASLLVHYLVQIYRAKDQVGVYRSSDKLHEHDIPQVEAH